MILPRVKAEWMSSWPVKRSYWGHIAIPDKGTEYLKPQFLSTPVFCLSSLRSLGNFARKPLFKVNFCVFFLISWQPLASRVHWMWFIGVTTVVEILWTKFFWQHYYKSKVCQQFCWMSINRRCEWGWHLLSVCTIHNLLSCGKVAGCVHTALAPAPVLVLTVESHGATPVWPQSRGARHNDWAFQ